MRDYYLKLRVDLNRAREVMDWIANQTRKAL